MRPLLFGGSLFKAFGSRSIHYKAVNEFSDKTIVATLQNNMNQAENKSEYCKRSLEELQKQLKEDMFYIYVDKASIEKPKSQMIKEPIIIPGHIASFLTNSEKKIIPESFISLRNHKKIDNKYLKFTLPHISNNKERIYPVSTIHFLTFESEFSNHFFKNATPDVLAEDDKKRFLLGVCTSKLPCGVRVLLKHIESVKDQLTTKEYILCDGYIGEEFVKSMNCVSGFYEGVNVQGNEPNPSPQMAAWSYIKMLLGPEQRDNLINSSGLRTHGADIRTHDDNLYRQKILNGPKR